MRIYVEWNTIAFMADRVVFFSEACYRRASRNRRRSLFIWPNYKEEAAAIVQQGFHGLAATFRHLTYFLPLSIYCWHRLFMGEAKYTSIIVLNERIWLLHCKAQSLRRRTRLCSLYCTYRVAISQKAKYNFCVCGTWERVVAVLTGKKRTYIFLFFPTADAVIQNIGQTTSSSITRYNHQLGYCLMKLFWIIRWTGFFFLFFLGGDWWCSSLT